MNALCCARSTGLTRPRPTRPCPPPSPPTPAHYALQLKHGAVGALGFEEVLLAQALKQVASHCDKLNLNINKMRQEQVQLDGSNPKPPTPPQWEEK